MSEELSKPNYYSITPASVRYDKRLKPLARLLYGEITALCNEQGYCWAKNAYFARLYEVDERSVSRWVSDLEAKGYITTKLIYKTNSKEIEKRLIYISDPLIVKNLGDGDKNVITPPDTRITPPTDKNVGTPPDNRVILGDDKNVVDNNKSLIDNSLFSFNNPKTATKQDLENYKKQKNYKSDLEEFWIKNEAKGWEKVKNRYAQFDGWENNFKKKNPELYLGEKEITAESKEIETLRDNLKKAFIANQLDYDLFLGGNAIEKRGNKFFIVVDEKSEKALRAKYQSILDKFNVKLEIK